MCGIVAFFAYNENAPDLAQEELLKVREAMVPRGPDGAGLWLAKDRRIGLAHRRLSIIDLTESGAQPMATKDRRFRIVFNGEIYNYQALRGDLEKKGRKFHSGSDTEVLLQLYADEGQAMVARLRGMYTFAIWDEAKQGLFLARDPFGIKPLYFADDGHAIKVASQVKALLKGDRIDTSPDPAGHVGFFLWGYVPEPHTLYTGIRALPAGSTLWLDKTGTREQKSFFNLTRELAAAGQNIVQEDARTPKERLRAALVDSVKHHLVADVPVGVFLSSGLDSTTLTALAAEVGCKDLRTVTLGFHEYKGTERDETVLAEKVAANYGTRHQTVWVARDDFSREIDHLIEAMDQPSVDGINTFFVSKIAAQIGLKTVISGLGGDELFGGYPSFNDVPRMANLPALSKMFPLASKAFRVVSAPVLRAFTSPKYAGLLEYGGDYGGAYLLRRGLLMPWELPAVLGGDMARAGWEELQPLVGLEKTVAGITNDRLKVSALEMTWYMRNQLLRDSDWAGMAHSLEIRTPLVDINLFRQTAPFFSMLTKKDMAGILANPLPAEVLSKEKTGFSVPVREWLLAEEQSTASRGLVGWAKLLYARDWVLASTI